MKRGTFQIVNEPHPQRHDEAPVTLARVWILVCAAVTLIGCGVCLWIMIGAR